MFKFQQIVSDQAQQVTQLNILSVCSPAVDLCRASYIVSKVMHLLDAHTKDRLPLSKCNLFYLSFVIVCSMVNYGDVNDVNENNTSPDSANGIREPNQNEINPTQDEILSHFQEVTGNSYIMSFL